MATYIHARFDNVAIASSRNIPIQIKLVAYGPIRPVAGFSPARAMTFKSGMRQNMHGNMHIAALYIRTVLKVRSRYGRNRSRTIIESIANTDIKYPICSVCDIFAMSMNQRKLRTKRVFLYAP